MCRSFWHKFFSVKPYTLANYWRVGIEMDCCLNDGSIKKLGNFLCQVGYFSCSFTFLSQNQFQFFCSFSSCFTSLNISICEGTISSSIKIFLQGVWPCTVLNDILVIRNHLAATCTIYHELLWSKFQIWHGSSTLRELISYVPSQPGFGSGYLFVF